MSLPSEKEAGEEAEAGLAFSLLSRGETRAQRSFVGVVLMLLLLLGVFAARGVSGPRLQRPLLGVTLLPLPSRGELLRNPSLVVGEVVAFDGEAAVLLFRGDGRQAVADGRKETGMSGVVIKKA